MDTVVEGGRLKADEISIKMVQILDLECNIPLLEY